MGQQGKLAVVTGATGGIGEAIAGALAAAGMTVVLVGRSDDRLRRARQRIATAVPGAELRLERADLSLLAEVRALADRLVAGEVPDVVVSNAVVMPEVDDVTAEGLQRTVATNHLALYLLLRSLVEPIGKWPARFVVVGASPSALRAAPVDLEDLQFANGRGLGEVSSNRAVRRVRTDEEHERDVRLRAGAAAGRYADRRERRASGHHPPCRAQPREPRCAAADAAGARAGHAWPGRRCGHAGVAGDVARDRRVTGRFFVRRRAVPTAPHTTDVARCDRLWEESARLTGLSPELRICGIP